jgi:5-methylcytosine-specific restriction protein B
MTALEKDKRDLKIVLPLSGERLAVPENVCIIGTMNTADRSISLLDAALRRRFGFIELMPDSSILKDSTIEGIQLGDWLDMVNSRIRKFLGEGARNLQIGHSYLLEENGKPISDFSKFQGIVHEEIIPLLEEYCYEDYYKSEKILGEALVDANAQKIHHELFESNRAALLGALSLKMTEFPNNDEEGLK